MVNFSKFVRLPARIGEHHAANITDKTLKLYLEAVSYFLDCLLRE